MEDRTKTRVFLVPKLNLFGIQPKEAYSTKSRKLTEELLNQPEGRGYLKMIENPAIVVPILSGDNVFLAVTDGHHRTRYVDRPVIPARIMQPEHAVKIFNRHTSAPVSTGEFIEDLVDSMHLAQRSFDSMPLEKKPSPVTGVRSLEELYGRFDELPNLPIDSLLRGPEILQTNVPVNILDDAYLIAEKEDRRRDFFDNMNA